MSRKMDVSVRPGEKKDLPAILSIIEDIVKKPPSGNYFLNLLKDSKNYPLRVADYRGKAAGFLVQDKNPGFLWLMDIVVRTVFHRCGVGSRLVEHMIAQLSYSELPKIYTEVRETNNIAIKFFAKQGFVVKRPFLREFYEDTGEDAVPMVYRLHGLSEQDDWTERKTKNIECWRGR